MVGVSVHDLLPPSLGAAYPLVGELVGELVYPVDHD